MPPMQRSVFATGTLSLKPTQDLRKRAPAEGHGERMFAARLTRSLRIIYGVADVLLLQWFHQQTDVECRNAVGIWQWGAMSKNGTALAVES
jgi:hypothetical protein